MDELNRNLNAPAAPAGVLSAMPKSKFRKFYLVVSIVAIITGTFLIWTLNIGSGENNQGVWLIFFAIPDAISIMAPIVVLGLLAKVFVNKFLNKGHKHPILVTTLMTLAFATVFGYPAISEILVRESSYLPIRYSGILLVGAPAFAITLLASLFKISQPDFWRFNLGPAMIAYFSWMFVLLFVIGSLNFLFTKAHMCKLVVGGLPRASCYFKKAVDSSDIALRAFAEGSRAGNCGIAIAVKTGNVSLCESSSYTQLLSLYKDPVGICKNEVVTYHPPTSSEIERMREEYRLEQAQRSTLEKIKDFLRGDY